MLMLLSCIIILVGFIFMKIVGIYTAGWILTGIWIVLGMFVPMGTTMAFVVSKILGQIPFAWPWIIIALIHDAYKYIKMSKLFMKK